ncbi:MAG: hypothetical protein ACOC0U_05655 [Desulfovibrionales bacterium]
MTNSSKTKEAFARITLGAIFLTLLLGCSPRNRPQQERMGNDQFQIIGTVVHVPLEGGFYGLVDQHGNKFDPVNLPPSFQREKIPIQATLTDAENRMSLRMWGRMVRILEIRRR